MIETKGQYNKTNVVSAPFPQPIHFFYAIVVVKPLRHGCELLYNTCPPSLLVNIFAFFWCTITSVLYTPLKNAGTLWLLATEHEQGRSSPQCMADFYIVIALGIFLVQQWKSWSRVWVIKDDQSLSHWDDFYDCSVRWSCKKSLPFTL